MLWFSALAFSQTEEGSPLDSLSSEAAHNAIKELQELRAEQKLADKLIHEWFRKWNALDGTEETTKEFMALFHPDATFEIGPNERQLHRLVDEGEALIRKMVGNFTKHWSDIAYRVTMRTVGETTVELIQTAKMPWEPWKLRLSSQADSLTLKSISAICCAAPHSSS